MKPNGVGRVADPVGPSKKAKANERKKDRLQQTKTAAKKARASGGSIDPHLALPLQPDSQQSGPNGSVLLLSSELQALQALLHFGPPSVVEKQNVQQLIAIPCQMCGIETLASAATEAFEPSVRELAQKLRPDISVQIRVEALHQVLQELGSDVLRLEGYFCLASVVVPFGWNDIEASQSDEERHWRHDVCSRIDLLPTASGRHRQGEVSAAVTPSRALRDLCRLTVEASCWDEALQLGLRRQLGVGFPVRLTAPDGGNVFVLILPDGAGASLREGVLCFSQELQVDGHAQASAPACELAAAAPSAHVDGMVFRSGFAEPCGGVHLLESLYSSAEPEGCSLFGQHWGEGIPQMAVEAAVEAEAQAQCGWAESAVSTDQVGRRAEPPLAAEAPLPEGWTEHYSKTTGRTYYYNTLTDVSTFKRPST